MTEKTAAVPPTPRATVSRIAAANPRFASRKRNADLMSCTRIASFIPFDAAEADPGAGSYPFRASTFC